MRIINLVAFLSLFIVLSGLANAQWYEQNSPAHNKNLYDVFAIDEQTALAVGDSNYIIKTTDGGENWTIKFDNSTDYHYYTSITFINANLGWIAGGSYKFYGGTSQILKTTDAGENWVSDSIGWGGLNSVYFVDQNIGWVVGSTDTDLPNVGIMFKTTDGGINWISQTNGAPCPLNFVFFIDQSIGWVGGNPTGNAWFQIDSTLYKSTAGGNTWMAMTFDSISYRSGFFIDENSGWVVGSKSNGLTYKGVIFKTSNGGDTWIEQQTGQINHLFDIYFIDPDTGWIVGEGGIVFKTIDGGINWFAQSSGINNTLHSVCFANENVGWAVGENGTILKTTNAGVTFLEGEDNFTHPDGYELAQNYPNPFNPITNISYTIPSESQVKLSIYNPLGELVETIVNEKQDAGKYDAVWNAGNHPSGVYIYTLDAVSLNGGKQIKLSKKMLLLK